MTSPKTLLLIIGIAGLGLVCPPCLGICDSPPTAPSPTPTSQKNLSDYARGRELRKQPGVAKNGVVINDDNLKEMAGEAELTSVTQSNAPVKASTAVPEISDPRGYWRSRIQAQLNRSRKLEDGLQSIESEIAGLWQMFYGCDDPVERHDRIRPQLVLKIAERAELVTKIDIAQGETAALLEDARKNGALPGWYRDLLQ